MKKTISHSRFGSKSQVILLCFVLSLASLLEPFPQKATARYGAERIIVIYRCTIPSGELSILNVFSREESSGFSPAPEINLENIGSVKFSYVRGIVQSSGRWISNDVAMIRATLLGKNPTADAVRSFQRSIGIQNPDGDWGQGTWTALVEYILAHHKEKLSINARDYCLIDLGKAVNNPEQLFADVRNQKADQNRLYGRLVAHIYRELRPFGSTSTDEVTATVAGIPGGDRIETPEKGLETGPEAPAVPKASADGKTTDETEIKETEGTRGEIAAPDVTPQGDVAEGKTDRPTGGPQSPRRPALGNAAQTPFPDTIEKSAEHNGTDGPRTQSRNYKWSLWVFLPLGLVGGPLVFRFCKKRGYLPSRDKGPVVRNSAKLDSEGSYKTIAKRIQIDKARRNTKAGDASSGKNRRPGDTPLPPSQDLLLLREDILRGIRKTIAADIEGITDTISDKVYSRIEKKTTQLHDVSMKLNMENREQLDGISQELQKATETPIVSALDSVPSDVVKIRESNRELKAGYGRLEERLARIETNMKEWLSPNDGFPALPLEILDRLDRLLRLPDALSGEVVRAVEEYVGGKSQDRFITDMSEMKTLLRKVGEELTATREKSDGATGTSIDSQIKRLHTDYRSIDSQLKGIYVKMTEWLSPNDPDPDFPPLPVEIINRLDSLKKILDDMDPKGNHPDRGGSQSSSIVQG